MTHFSRSTPLAAINVFGLAVLCGLFSACALFPGEPAPAPVAQTAPQPVAAPTPAPVVYADCSGYLDGSPDGEVIPDPLQADTDALRAAAIHELFKDPSVQRSLATVGAGYIAIGANKNALQDPSDTLLGGIKVGGLAVKKYSQCVAGAAGVRDAASGARGVVIRVCRICWSGPSSAMLEYGYSTGGIHGQTVLAEAQRVADAWTFTERKISIY